MFFVSDAVRKQRRVSSVSVFVCVCVAGDSKELHLLCFRAQLFAQRSGGRTQSHSERGACDAAEGALIRADGTKSLKSAKQDNCFGLMSRREIHCSSI